jgi:hypothetical protein
MSNPVNEKQSITKKSTTLFLTKARDSINLQNSLILLSLIILLFLTNIFKTELEIQQQINKLARYKLTQKEEVLLKNFKYIIENNSNYLANNESLNKSRETLIKKIILKEKFLKFNNTKLEASQIKALEKFSHDINNLYELDYFLADQYKIQGDFKNQCLYELKAFYKQLLNSAVPSLERKILETGDLELSLRLLIIKH